MLLSSLLAALIAPHAKPAAISREESARHFLLGVAHHLDGDSLRAAWEFTHAVHFDPTNADAWLARAMVFEQSDQGNQAIADLTRVIGLGEDADARLHRAYWLALRNDHRAALADLTEVVELDPRNEVAWRNRGIAHAALGEPELALSDLTRALEFDPDSAESLRLRGAIRGQLGGYDESIRDLSAALTATPDDGQALTWRGISHFAAGHYESASADFAAALRLDPTNYLACVNRGQMHAHLGQDLKAEVDFARAIELKPDDPNAHLQRGDLHAKSGDSATAVRCFTRVIALSPKDATAYRKRAALNSADGKHAAQLADLMKVAELEPAAQVFAELARLRLDCPDLALRDAKKAVELADKAWALSRIAAARPFDPSYDQLRASALATAGDHERAIHVLDGMLSSEQLNAEDRVRVSDHLELYKRVAEQRRTERTVVVKEEVVVRAQMELLPPLPPLSEVGKVPPGELPPIVIPEIGKN